MRSAKELGEYGSVVVVPGGAPGGLDRVGDPGCGEVVEEGYILAHPLNHQLRASVKMQRYIGMLCLVLVEFI